MRKTPGRRPGQGAAPRNHVAISNSNVGNVADPGTEPQLLDSAWARNSFPLTVIAKSNGPLTKRISLNPDGTVKSDRSACFIADARRVDLAEKGPAWMVPRSRRCAPNGSNSWWGR